MIFHKQKNLREGVISHFIVRTKRFITPVTAVLKIPFVSTNTLAFIETRGRAIGIDRIETR
jgi:hypothetical protein